MNFTLVSRYIYILSKDIVKNTISHEKGDALTNWQVSSHRGGLRLKYCDLYCGF